MSGQSFIALAHNIALLLAVALLFDLSTTHRKLGQARLEQVLLGLFLGCVGLVIMSTPWTLMPGVVFDTRSVLLGVSGLFFGTLPTAVAAVMVSLFRLHQGGAGAWTGVSVILASGVIGILWRHLRLKKLSTLAWWELLLFGFAIHVVMLALMLTLPWEIAFKVLSLITLPVLLIYPLGTSLLGVLMVRRLRREEAVWTIRDSEERYKALYNSVMDPILVVDADTCIILDCNSAAEKMFGRTRPALVGLHLTSLEPAEEGDLNTIAHLFSHRLENSGVKQESRFLRPDGSTVLTEVRATRFQLQGQNLILGIFHDVTEAKRSEQALRLSEARHRALVSCFPGGAVFLCDPDFRYRVVGGRVFEDLDMDPSTVEGKTIREAFPELADRIEPYVKRAFEGNSIYYEVEFMGRIFANYGVPLLDEKEQVVQVAVMSMDITERNKAEKVLVDNERRFRELLDDVEMISVQGYDEDRRVTFWNLASERLYGWTRQEAIGSKLEDLIIPDSMREDVIEGIEKWICEGVRIPSGELELRDKYGNAVPVYSSHTLRQGFDGKKEMFCMDVDLADIKHAHEELMKAKEAAEEASRIKSEFLANMSHEIRTPMNGVLGMLQLLQTTSIDEEQREYVLTAIQSSKRLTRLLSDILDLSRVEANRLSIQTQPLDIREVIDQTCEMFKPMTQQTGLGLHCHVDPKIPNSLNGDAARIQQVLTNIIGNAFKFTKTGGITVEAHSLRCAEKDKCRVLFSVSDTGIGIPEEKVVSLFKPFSQVSMGYSRDYQGAGLGLSICRKLVELMGGNIAIESAPNEGTVVHFCIPFSLDDPVPRLEVLDPAPDRNVALRILLAEDEAVNRLATTRLLEKQGHTVEAVENGQKAVSLLKEGVFDMVLMDIQMPVMDGIEATRAIRNEEKEHRNRDIPIIAMTAYAMGGDREMFLEVGMDDYIAKPVDMQQLEVLLQKIFRGNDRN